jgi:hypothetical protein
MYWGKGKRIIYKSIMKSWIIRPEYFINVTTWESLRIEKDYSPLLLPGF